MKSNFLNQIRLPRLSDIGFIAVELTAVSFVIDSEHQTHVNYEIYNI